MSLVAELRAAGELPTAWQPAFEAVQRTRYIPDQIWVETDSRYVPIDRVSAPDDWTAAVASDAVVVTQFDDGATQWPDVGYRPSCSSSMPSTMAGMLDALDVGEGHHVLEIGTGTGYNAALLATRAASVTTVEIDQAVAECARLSLADASNVRVVTGDGTCGGLGRFDRIIITAAVRLGQIPYSWVEQTAPGGVIVLPVRADLASGPLVRLVVDQGTATGRPTPMRVGFMELRGHRTPSRWQRLHWDDPSSDQTVTDVEPWSALLNEASRWAIAVSVPQCKYTVWEKTSERPHGVAWLVDTCSGSWASVVPGHHGYVVRQHGPRRLWDEAERAYRWWRESGCPELDKWRITVTSDQQRAEYADAN